MYTQCPQCQACFEVSVDQLKIGDGDVRCGQCLSIFNALHHLSENLPTLDDSHPAAPVDTGEDKPAEYIAAATDRPCDEPPMGNIDSVTTEEQPSTEHTSEIFAVEEAENFTRQQIDAIQFSGGTPNDAAAPEDSTAVLPFVPDGTEQATEEPPAPAAKTTENTETPAEPIVEAERIEVESIEVESIEVENIANKDTDDAMMTSAEDGPISHLPAPLIRQLQDEKAASLRPPTTPWVIASLLMIVLFLAQGSYFYRDTLAQQQPELRPWLELACGYLDCTVRRPPSHAKIDILGWDVRTLPNTPQALIASTTLINNHHDIQPYPLLTLRFSDITGAPLAQRRFLPREYLPSGTDIKAGMLPDTPVPVELALLDPGKQAVNFEFHTEPSQVFKP